MSLLLLDSRRLTGANLCWDRTSAVIDVGISGAPESVIAHWATSVGELLEATGHAGESTCQRIFDGGASLLISAAIDALYSMCELNELAWQQAVHACQQGPAPEMRIELERLRELFAAERRPRLLALQQAAREQGVPFLWDEDEVSVGYGKHCRVWPCEDIPAPPQVNWAEAGTIPLALVTGTNGKSTTVRMTAAIINAAGLRAGLTSTDFIRLGDEIIEEGDYSGSGGARRLLRHPGVELAVLEVARGGLLRRGLGVERADTALITNVAADHLGEYGINSVTDLIEAKFIVRRALGRKAPLILNADDLGIASHARGLDNTIWWFSLDAIHPLIQANIDQGIGACWLQDGVLFSNAGRGSLPGEVRPMITVNEIPASHGGRVGHNVQNAMGAVLVSLALGVPDSAIGAGLAAFRGDENDNPGRGNWFEHHGVRIIVDFAHNEHGLQALARTVNAMGAERVAIMLGQAGDRSDELIRGLTQAGCSMQPDRLLVCELPGYERGRDLAEVPELIRREALACGVPAANIEIFSGPALAARDALGWARTGDVLVFLALTQREEILKMVHEFIDG